MMPMLCRGHVVICQPLKPCRAITASRHAGAIGLVTATFCKRDLIELHHRRHRDNAVFRHDGDIAAGLQDAAPPERLGNLVEPLERPSGIAGFNPS
jgi:hypothetical protein